jgi:hypothetical protein
MTAEAERLITQVDMAAKASDRSGSPIRQAICPTRMIAARAGTSLRNRVLRVLVREAIVTRRVIAGWAGVKLRQCRTCVTMR